jgi:uncharacterized protein YceH (UPF0502 family)
MLAASLRIERNPNRIAAFRDIRTFAAHQTSLLTAGPVSRCCMALVVLLTRRIRVERIRKISQPRTGMPMTSVDLEQRVAALEAELAKLKAELRAASG